MKIIWIVCGLSALSLGTVGVVLPLLPTVPFLLLAAFCFARSSEKLHDWLTGHPKFGPPIEDWNRNGTISLHAKTYATVSVIAAFSLSLYLDLKASILLIQAITLTCVMIFLWTRPTS